MKRANRKNNAKLVRSRSGRSVENRHCPMDLTRYLRCGWKWTAKKIKGSGTECQQRREK